tara:strand:+ start:729 stop:1070 length:342 start_codon:yes stop_codon:yes gene_type:complete
MALAGCPGGEGATRLKAGAARLVYRPVGEMVVGEPFEMEICIDPVPDDVRLTVDAIMPAHGHGMNYEVEVREIEPGQYVAEGFILHMPGLWRFRFIQRADGVEAAFSSDRQVQ